MDLHASGGDDRPVPIELDDPGASWRPAGKGLVLEREPTTKALALPVGLGVAFAVGGVLFLREGRTFWALAAGAAAVVAAVYTVFSKGQRIRLAVESDRLSWRSHFPRNASGRWPRSEIDGVRIETLPSLGPGSTRVKKIEVHVGDRWRMVATGRDEATVERFADDLAEALEVDRRG